MSSTTNTVADGGTDNAGAIDSGTATTITYDVSNSGTAALNLSGLTQGATTNASFGATSIVTSTVAVGTTENDAISITFTPSSTTDGATFSAAFSFTTNDAQDGTNEITYNVTISGTINAEAEIDNLVSSTTNTVADGGTDNAGAIDSGTATTITYDVTNSGTGPLNLSGLTLGATSNASFGTTSIVTSTVAVGTTENDAISITFTPSSTTDGATFSAAFSFTTNDAQDGTNEITYNVTISGTINAEAEIDNLVSSTTNTVADGGTDNAGAIDSGTATTITYDVTNSGTGPLNLSGLTPGATSNASFGTTSIVTSTVAVGTTENDAISITFTPSSTTDGATFSAAFSFTTNDAQDGTNEITYNVTISGTINAEAEIDNLVSSTTNTVADGGTDNAGAIDSGTATTITYDVTNSGTGPLNLSGLTPGATSNASFGTTSIVTSTVAVGATENDAISITFTPSSTTDGATFSAAFSFTTNDAQDGTNEITYNVTISGTINAEAEIDNLVSSTTNTVADGGTDNAGAIDSGTATTITYDVTNSGTGPLNLSGLTQGATTNASFGTTSIVTSTVAVGATENDAISITFTPSSTTDGASFSVAFSFTTNDAQDGTNEITYNVTISGTINAEAEIDNLVSSTTNTVADGGTDNAGAIDSGTATTITYDVTNSGTGPLNLSGLTQGATSNASFGTTSIVASTVAVGATENDAISITFTPSSTTDGASFSVAFSFTTNDAQDGTDETTFNVTISGTINAEAEIDNLVSSTTNTVADGGTDNAGNIISGTVTTLTYDVTNSGTGPLNLSGLTQGATSNASFGTTSIVTGTVGAGTTENDAISITFTPSSTTDGASFSVAFSFTTNDAQDGTNETTYNVTISGAINAEAEIDNLVSSTTNSVADGGTDTVAAAINSGTATTLTYDVTNSGTGPLNLSGLTQGATSNASFGATSIVTSTVVAGSTENDAISITFTPSSTTDGASFSVAFSFTTNDAQDGTDETTFNVTISGTINAEAEIDNLVSSTTNTVADGGTDNAGNLVSGTATTITYDVTNSGGAALNLSGLTQGATSNASFGTTSIVTSTVAVGATENDAISITFTPSSTADGASFSVAFSFTTNDAQDGTDETTFNVTISGTINAEAEIDNLVSSTTNTVADGGSDNAGNIISGTVTTITYDVTNSGTGPLNLTGLTQGAISNASFGATSIVTGTVGAGSTENDAISITFTPSSTTDGASFSVAFSFTTNDAQDGTDETTFNVTISGTINAEAEIDNLVSSTTNTVADGGTDTAGAIDSGTATTITYDVTNSGTGPLNLSGLTQGATSNASFGTTSIVTSTVAVGATENDAISITFTPSSTTDGSSFSVAFSFTTNDAQDGTDETTFNVTISGTINAEAEIDNLVSSTTNTVADGGTDAQGTRVAGDLVSVTYTITNSGGSSLTLETATSANASNVTVNSISAPGSTTVTGSGGTTTFTVQYTPTLAGAFSFDVSFVNNDSDENPFDFTVSGTAQGDPEIEVSSSESGAITDGGTDTVASTIVAGNAATVTYTVTNSGTDTLAITTPTVAGNISATSNVTVNNLSLGSTSVGAGGGTTTLVVDYTARAGGAFGFELSLANDDGDENPFDVIVSGTATSAAMELVITSGSGQAAEINTEFDDVLVATARDSNGNGVAGVDVTFTAPESGASLTFAGSGTHVETVTTAADGTATSTAMTANGTASTYHGGNSLTPYDVTASATGLTSVSFSLTNDRDADADIQKTKEVIASFVTNRANAIVSGQPDFVSRLTNGPFRQQIGRNSFNFNVTPYAQSGNFQFSMRAFANSMRQARAGQGAGHSADEELTAPGPAADDRYAAFGNFKSSGTMSYTAVAPPIVEDEALAVLSAAYGTPADETTETSRDWQSGWDFWAQGTYAITDNNNSNSQTGLIFAGVDYRYKDRAVVGLMGQLDITEEDNGSANTSADGIGWMAGPYAVLRVHQNFYLDGAFTYGQSYNSVNALGLFEDDFRTQRFLLQGGLTGDFKLNETTRISPFTRITYYFEEQESYTDTLGRLILSQEFDLGRLEFGPKISWDLQLNEILFSPFLSLSGIYDFNKLQDDIPTDATLASSDEDLRARLEAGAGLLIPGRDIRISGEGYFDGIGTQDFRSYGVTLNVTIPF